MNVHNGKKRWVFPAKAAFVASPILFNGVIYIGSTDKTFYAVEASSGRMKWRVETNAPILATAACAHGVVCFGTAGSIYGLDIENGNKRWVHPADGPFESAAATDGNAFYLGGWDNTCYALDASSGTERWHVKIGASTPQSPAVASPCVLHGSVYYAAGDGMLHCLDAAHGSETWAKQAPIGGDTISSCSPAACGSSIIVCGDGKLGSVYSFDGDTGALLWHLDIGQTIEASGVHPAPNGLSFALMGVRGRTEVLSAHNGYRLWGYELGPGNIFSTPAYDGSALFTTTMADDVQAINGPGVEK
jgi:outer membrane protein assembly factor BamB